MSAGKITQTMDFVVLGKLTIQNVVYKIHWK